MNVYFKSSIASAGDGLGNLSVPSGRSVLTGVGGCDDVVVGGATAFANVMNIRQSPPKAIVDSSPLQPVMDRNKECKFSVFVHKFDALFFHLLKLNDLSLFFYF